MERKFVKLVCRDPEEGSHLVYECSRTACTASVHSLFNAACEEDYLRVLAAKLDDRVCVRLFLLYGEKCCVDFLHERDIRRVCESESGRTCYTDRELFIGIVRLNEFKLILYCFLDL